jgi:hypothetical protein
MTDLRIPALARPALNSPEEVATVENIMRSTGATRQSALLCATPAADLRTSRVRGDVCLGLGWAQASAIQGKRVRTTAPTTGMGHVGTASIFFGAGTVPGFSTWSPPI